MDVAERIRITPARPLPVRRGTVILLVGIVAGGTVLAILRGTGLPQVNVFLLVSTSLLIEAFPFVLFGAVVSAALEAFVPARAFARVARLPGFVQVPVAGVMGFGMPICDCGSIPVARRLLQKGVRPAAAITFMLAAPIVNPVSILSTAVAYRALGLAGPMVLGRVGLGLLVAMATGWVLARRSGGELLRSRHHGHDSGADGDVHCEDGCCSPQTGSRLGVFFGQIGTEFTTLGKFLVLGAVVAGLMKTFVPQTVLASVAETPVLSMVALMALAAMLSLCSAADAFVAASFVQFGPASQLAFLVFGPMVDTKLAFLYRGTFTKGVASRLVLVVGSFVLVTSLWMEVVLG